VRPSPFVGSLPQLTSAPVDRKTITIIPKFLYMHINGRHVSFSARLGDHLSYHR
jgi:hypothetical protein